MRWGDALGVLCIILAGFVRHIEYFPPWAQMLIALGWSVVAFYATRGVR